MPMPQFVPNVVTQKDLEALFSVSKQAIQQWMDAGDFPPWATVLSSGRVWSLDEVETWATHRGRPTSRKALLTCLRSHEQEVEHELRQKAARNRAALRKAAESRKPRKAQ